MELFLYFLHYTSCIAIWYGMVFVIITVIINFPPLLLLLLLLRLKSLSLTLNSSFLIFFIYKYKYKYSYTYNKHNNRYFVVEYRIEIELRNY